MRKLSAHTEAVQYLRDGPRVEFDAPRCDETVLGAARNCSTKTDELSIESLVFKGQAVSLVMLDPHGDHVRNGISWLSERLVVECAELSREYPRDRASPITGQPAIIPTSPITKILWVKRQEPEVFGRTAPLLLSKDCIKNRLTEKEDRREYSIDNLTRCFDIV